MCYFFQKFENLGHNLICGFLGVVLKNVNLIKTFLHNRQQTNKVILGAFNAYQKFIKGCFRIAWPLNDYLQKDEK